LPSFSKKFNKKYLIGSKETRARKFNPQKLFLSLLHLVGGKNYEGYFHALSRTWDTDSDLKKMPVKSALTKVRGRVSFEFFEDQFVECIAAYEPHRRTWRDLRVYATDGDRYDLPRTEDILKEGYRGFPFSKTKETYCPQMYVVHCYDVLGGVTKEFRYSNKNEEVHAAVEIATTLESKSVTLYDRLFLGKDLIRAHATSKSHFVARCKEGTFSEVREFFKSNKRNTSFTFEGVTIELVKIIHPKTGEVAVYATNLARSRFKNKEIAELYALRWEVETSNRDMTHTIKVEQWHSHFLNGILQELYTALWWMNQTRIQMAAPMRSRCTLKSLFTYAKSNFKLILDFILDSLKDLAANRINRVHRRLKILLEVSLENRKRRSRSLPRQVRRRPKIYKLASAVPRSVK
jgi:Transposase DDE domain